MLSVACCNFSCVFFSTVAKLPKSALTAPSSFHTSAERRSMASVRKPICRLLSKASSVLGPAMSTRCSRWMASTADACCITSA